MCGCKGEIECGYHRRERCKHERRERFWQSETAVCRDCDLIVPWEESK